MPSPFPGMDPYLEAPDIWPDLHERLAAEISAELNRTLPGPYYALLQMRPEVGIVHEGKTQRRITPHLAIVSRPPHQQSQKAATVIERRQRDVSTSYEIAVPSEPIRHDFIEIRDSAQGHKLITLIEILSPSNKRPGPDREAYQRKQREVLDSDASLVEIDLLRSGERVLPDLNLGALIGELDVPSDYLVLVNRSWRRADRLGFEVFPFGLRDTLPCISIPLREGEDEVRLDLQVVFDQAYAGGPYLLGAVDYSRPPSPPLVESDAPWAEARIRDRSSEAG